MSQTMILVLGMHRSGTSALTRLLNLHGATLPDALIGPAPENQTGHWEPEVLVALNDDILAAASRSWHDPRALPPSWFNSPEAAMFEAQLADALREEFGNAPLSVMKDPRLCLLLPLWLRVLEALNITPKVVIPLRHPSEIAASLARRQQAPAPKFLLLWLRYMLAAERGSRGLTRCFVNYPALLEDWQHEIKQIGGKLGITWPMAPANVDKFLSPDLRHHHCAEPLPAPMETVHNWLTEALDHEPLYEIIDSIAARLADADIFMDGTLGALEADAQHWLTETRAWVHKAQALEAKAANHNHG
jgi:hypothetical protein